ncbi:MAG: insulinase family protein [Prevotellaceae bacterium]|jgi:zinc protease|nr:insulinase family protein [Prevotellaceae bacterium]
MKKHLTQLSLVATLFFTFACSNAAQGPYLSYESYTLDNGLKIVLHQDHSDPIVTLAIQYHVGSGREKPGRTGFAHFFEHMLFQRSENLPRNAFFQKIAAMGGSFNGSTNSDGTNYFETVPRDALEKVLWMESDRMGFFISTVTQGGLEREIDIVSNEKRQNYDTQPYGQSSIIIAKELYPEGHPYSWTTIGEIDDLRNATIDDVKEFYAAYYVPNNATLVLAGDFDRELAKELIQKYFGEIPRGNDVPKPTPLPVQLDQKKRIFWEDDFAKLPDLEIVFPGVEQYHNDSPALSALASLLAGGKQSPLYKIVVEEKKLAPNVTGNSRSSELAGGVQFGVRAFEGTCLESVYEAIHEAFVRFEEEGVDEEELQRLKVMQEVNLYNRIGGIQGKALMMARDNEFGGSPVATFNELLKFQAITKQQIMDVFDRYIKEKNYIALSIVPKGQKDLALADSKPAVVSTEKVEEIESKSEAGKLADDDYVRTISAIDRSVEPDYLPNRPEICVPAVWNFTTANGMEVYGIEHRELPIIQAKISIKGGTMLDPAAKKGLAYLNARLMNEGTALKTADQLERTMGLLGARIEITSGTEGLTLSISGLSKNFAQVMELVEEMLLQPRFDQEALMRVKMQTKSMIRQNSANPRNIAQRTRDMLLYGANGTFAIPEYGTAATVDNITLDDIKAFYLAYISPSIASLSIAGDIDKATCEKVLTSLNNNWITKEVVIPEPVQGIPAKGATIYFVDNPGVTQSMINVSTKGMPMNDPNYYPAMIANFRLGTGSQGMLFDVIRLQRGYTYGAYSAFENGEFHNSFTASSSVQGSVTKESVELFKELIGTYEERFDQEMLEVTKNSMMRAMASSFETVGALVTMLNNIATYGLPFDYVKQNEQTLHNITLDQIKEVVNKTMNPNDMVYIVVGDAKTQMAPLGKIGLGKPVLVVR